MIEYAGVYLFFGGIIVLAAVLCFSGQIDEYFSKSAVKYHRQSMIIGEKIAPSQDETMPRQMTPAEVHEMRVEMSRRWNERKSNDE